MLTQILASVQQSGVPGMKVGAGTGASQVNPSAMEFIPAYVTLPLDYIDIHIYAINDDFLPIALQMANTAAAAGLPVAMSECWMWKVLDTELNVLSPDEIRARDPFSFWAPLDAYFVQTMQSQANYTQMLYQDFFGTQYFFVYQAYGPATENLTPTEILGQQNQLVQAANTNGGGERLQSGTFLHTKRGAQTWDGGGDVRWHSRGYLCFSTTYAINTCPCREKQFSTSTEIGTRLST